MSKGISAELNIIHLFNDDKFIDITIQLFETVIPNWSQYYVLKTNDAPLKYVSSTKAIPVVVSNKQEVEQFKTQLKSKTYNAVFIHALNDIKLQLFDALRKEAVKVWFSWGYDLYPNLKKYANNSFEKHTLHFLNSHETKTPRKQFLIKSKAAKLLYISSKKTGIKLPDKLQTILENEYHASFKEAVKAIDVFVPVIPTEIKLLKEFKIRPQYAPFTYGYLEHLLGNTVHENVLNAKHILIGNSADPTNNHVEVFRKISKFNLENRLVYVPLNYGGNEAYRNYVIEQGQFYLGDKFKPILDFLPLEQYNKIMASCGYLMLNHKRQQAVGNIIMAGYLGAKVFLNSKSPVFSYYQNLGLNIYGMHDLKENDIFEGLSENAFQQNQKIFEAYYSKEVVINKVKTLVDIVSNTIVNNE